MSLTEKITSAIKDAMKAKDQNKLAALRAIKSELLLLQTSGDASSPDAEIKMLQKLVKQRKESAEIYDSQNRKDLSETELFQAGIISEFLPRQLSDNELETELNRIITSVGAKSPGDMGRVMAAAGKELAGKADGKTISVKVKELLSKV